LQISACPRPALDPTLLRALWGIIGILILSNILLIPSGTELASVDGSWGYLLRQIDLNSEGTLATWCSSMLLFLNSLCAYILARAFWAKDRRVARLLALISFGFLALSIDDFIEFHEFVEGLEAGLLGSGGWQVSKATLGPLFAASLAVILTALFAASSIRVACREGTPLVIASIACVCAGALAEGVYILSGCDAPWCLRIEVVCEEGCELLALVFFLSFQSRWMRTLRDKNV